MDGKILDHRGDSFVPTKDQARLYKAGWRIVEKKSRGMVKIIKWADPKDGVAWMQGTALQILKDRAKAETK